MADVEQTKLGDLFPSSVFTIPKYQRGYAWTDQEVRDLLEDIEYTQEEREQEGRNSFSHYFGTIVLLDTGTADSETRDFDSFDIIDGQQRLATVVILINCINDEFREIDQSRLTKEPAASPSDLAKENRKEFIIQYETKRINLDTINNPVFQSLVIHDDPLDTIQTDNLSQRRLTAAKQEIQDWLADYRREFDTEDEYFEFLRDVQKILKTGFEVTEYIIENETEAGRLFEVINDRGKNLTTLDKIKSYLVYCAARLDNQDLSREVYRKVGEVVENVTSEGGDDSEIDAFVRYHWMMFTGELILARQSDSDYTSVHRRLKHLEKHASLDQPKDNLLRWINNYLESLLRCSKAYFDIKNPYKIENDYENLEEVQNNLDGINRLPVSNNFLPLLLSVHNRFGIGAEFDKVADLCEKLSFRVYNIAGRRTDAGRSALQRRGYWIEWAGRLDDAEQIFLGEQSAIEFEMKEAAIPKTCSRMESEIGENCPDTFFVDCLLRDDLFDGTDRNDGWTGVRNKEVIRYLLYRYEKRLRSQDTRSELTQIPSFGEWKSEGITIEHIHPQTTEGKEKNADLDDLTDTLGNMILLGPEDNAGVGNKDYATKYEDTYRDSSMAMIDDLPDPEESELTAESLRERAYDIARFAMEEWGKLSTAHLHVKELPEGVDITAARPIAHSIREYHRSEGGLTVPSVSIQTSGVQNSEDWKTMNSCPKCDSTLVEIHADDGWDADCGGCGTTLPEPVYKFKKSEYLKPVSSAPISQFEG